MKSVKVTLAVFAIVFSILACSSPLRKTQVGDTRYVHETFLANKNDIGTAMWLKKQSTNCYLSVGAVTVTEISPNGALLVSDGTCAVWVLEWQVPKKPK